MSDERIEVAKRLRSKFVRKLGVTAGALAYALCYIAPKGVVGDAAISDLWNHFADLVDPTCHYLPDEIAVWFDDDDIEHEDVTLMNFDGDAASCDVCGYMMMAGDNGWFDMERLEHGYKLTPRFDFCPYCGARVVSSDER